MFSLASVASKDSAQLFGLNASSWALSTMLPSACERFGPFHARAMLNVCGSASAGSVNVAQQTCTSKLPIRGHWFLPFGSCLPLTSTLYVFEKRFGGFQPVSVTCGLGPAGRPARELLSPAAAGGLPLEQRTTHNRSHRCTPKAYKSYTSDLCASLCRCFAAYGTALQAVLLLGCSSMASPVG